MRDNLTTTIPEYFKNRTDLERVPACTMSIGYEYYFNHSPDASVTAWIHYDDKSLWDDEAPTKFVIEKLINQNTVPFSNLETFATNDENEAIRVFEEWIEKTKKETGYND